MTHNTLATLNSAILAAIPFTVLSWMFISY
jgi:hypothetical protein